MAEPLLSGCLIAYNQVRYIKEAVASFLMQRIEIPMEVIIDDDFSKDGKR